MTALLPLCAEELDEWAERGIPVHDARSWYQTLGDFCGPPSAETWALESNESPSDHALSYAIYWLVVFGAANYDDAAAWLAQFPAPYNGADLAAPWREAGWGQSGDAARSPEQAAEFAKLNVSPEEAETQLQAATSDVTGDIERR